MVRRVSRRNYRSKRVSRRYLRSKRVKSGGSRSLRKRVRSKSVRKLRSRRNRRMRGGSLEWDELERLFSGNHRVKIHNHSKGTYRTGKIIDIPHKSNESSGNYTIKYDMLENQDEPEPETVVNRTQISKYNPDEESLY